MITGIDINTMHTFLLFKLFKVLHILTKKRARGFSPFVRTKIYIKELNNLKKELNNLIKELNRVYNIYMYTL